MSTRKHDRTRFIYRLRVHGTGADADRSFTGQLVDVTAQGMMLVINRPLKSGARPTLTIELPRNTLGDGRMTFDATVRWCEPSATEGLHAVGVYLTHVPAASRDMLRLLVDRFHELEPDDGYREDEDPFVQNKTHDPLARPGPSD